MATSLSAELAAAAARLVVEEGMEYGAAKKRAVRDLGRGRGTELPSNEMVEEQVREYLQVFHADTQPQELAALRRLALRWMRRLAEFRPHLSGAAWRGTATRLSNLHLDLYCDDPKSAEIGMLNQGIDYELAGQQPRGPGQEPYDVLSVASRSEELGEVVTLFLHVRDLDELRGALKPDATGRTWRGDAAALQRLLDAEEGEDRGGGA
ncbi:hypothetical protein [Azohydromonas aeria]|uniref:hypothetical protein n=1 Tax=Azohydromonas aeria TaxID=2590212 RepID=UPI0012F83BD5|nr:hypothetical protein [Azohydromonas aeria]